MTRPKDFKEKHWKRAWCLNCQRVSFSEIVGICICPHCGREALVYDGTEGYVPIMSGQRRVEKQAR